MGRRGGARREGLDSVILEREIIRKEYGIRNGFSFLLRNCGGGSSERSKNEEREGTMLQQREKSVFSVTIDSIIFDFVSILGMFTNQIILVSN